MIGFYVRVQFSDMYRHGSAFNFWIIIGMAFGLMHQYQLKKAIQKNGVNVFSNL